MVLGPQVEQITDVAVDPLAEELEREQLRKARLASAEKWKEFYALLFAFVAFSVSPLASRFATPHITVARFLFMFVFILWVGC